MYIRYRLADPAVTSLWLQLRAVAEQQLAEVERTLAAYRPHRYDFEQISADELGERLSHNEVVLLDVRPTAEYQAGHLPRSHFYSSGRIGTPLE